ncbi:MAG: flagellar filament capping protein FliD [Planctomycetota bacterium]|jgi:flagellar hook-associated protein 2
MPEIRFPGLATGIDTGELVKQLVEVESRRLKAKQEEVSGEQIKSDALSELQSKLTTYRTNIRKLSDSSQLRGFNTSTSDSDFITASASYSASEGSHSIQVKQLATTDRWVHDGLKYATTYVKDSAENGVLILSYNNEEMVIQTTDTTTLEDLADLINNDSDNPGITASVLQFDAGDDQVYHLVLGGEDSGSDYQIKINDSNTEVHAADSTLEYDSENAGVTTKIADLDSFSGTIESGSTDDRIRIQGNQHNGTAVDSYFDVTQYTTIEDLLGEIEEAFGDSVTATFSEGIIKVTDNINGTSSLSLTLTFTAGTGSDAAITLPTFTQTTQGGSTVASLASLASSTFTETQSAQDSMIKVDGYPSTTDTAEVQILNSSQDATGGTYTLSFNGETTATLDYNDPIGDVETALNNLSTIAAVGGVTVSGAPPDDSGTDMTITFLDTAGNVNQITMSSSLTPGTHALSTQTEGNNGWISRSTNTVNDIIAGVTLSLHDDTYNSDTTNYDSIEITLTRDTEQLKEKLDTMIASYNDVIKFIQEKSEYDSETKTAPVLYGEYSITTIKGQIENPLILAAGGFTTDDSFAMPNDIGLTINSDDMLELDTNTFDDALIDDYRGVLALIGAMKSGSSSGDDAAYIKFYEAGNHTQGGDYDIRILGTNGGPITSVEIKTTDEDWSEARTVDSSNFDGNYVTTDSEFDDNGNPLYSENGLSFTVDLDQLDLATHLEATIHVKHGFAGETKDNLDDILAYNGRIPFAKESISDHIELLNEQIRDEQERVEAFENRQILKFARLEKTLQMINQQMSGLKMLG